MTGTSPRRSFSLGTALLGCLLGCAADKPPPPPQQAPPAAAPTFVSLLQTSERPMKQGDALTYGTAHELPVCTFDPRVHSSAANSGLLLRFTAPVPTDLGVQLDTPLGPIRAVAPSGLEDEDRLARSGRAYFY